MAKKKQRKRAPYIGGGILTDNSSRDKSGKMNAYGIFTMFWAWDFPCNRHAEAIITMFNIPKQKTKVTISVKKKGNKAKNIASLIVESKKANPIPLVSNIPLPLTFFSEGSYELLFSIPRTRRTFTIAFEIRKNVWPELTKSEIKFAKSNPSFIQIRRANVQCSKCKRAYIFEDNILGTPPDAGVEKFPESGKYKCISEGCKKTLELRDLQGLLRSSLKDGVRQAMGRKP